MSREGFGEDGMGMSTERSCAFRYAYWIGYLIGFAIFAAGLSLCWLGVRLLAKLTQPGLAS